MCIYLNTEYWPELSFKGTLMQISKSVDIIAEEFTLQQLF